MTVILKSLVNGIYTSFLSSFIILPIFFCFLNIIGLTFLRSTTEENYYFITILTKVHSVTWTKINFLFIHAVTYAFYSRKVAKLQFVYCLVILAAATLFNSKNHLSNGERPSMLIYC